MYPEKFSIFPEVNGEVSYRDTVLAEGVCKDTLFARGERWLRHELVRQHQVHLPEDSNLYQRVIRYYLTTADTATGTLAARMTMPVNFHYPSMNLAYNPWDVFYTVNISVRDSSYDYEITNFSANFMDAYIEQTTTGGGWVGSILNRVFPTTEIRKAEIGNQVSSVFIKEFKKKNVVSFFMEVNQRIRASIVSLKDALHKKRIAAPFDKTFCDSE